MIHAPVIGGARFRTAFTTYFTDLVTIRSPATTANDCNEPVQTFADLAGHVDLHAVVMPGDIYAKMKRQETMTTQGSTEYEYRRIMLDGYYPLILLTHHAETENFEWDIVAIDIDTTRTFTQLLVERVSPGAI
jgi:hypothetical protein